MPRFLFILSIFVVGCLPFAVFARDSTAALDSFVRREWTVDGVVRSALVRVPKNSNGAMPLIFGWHGHGGTAEGAIRSWGIDQEWPEAIQVYPQGLPTPGRLTDPEGRKAGWQSVSGDQGDRDVKFFDTILSTLLAEQQLDRKRIYSTGHSNGAGFTYLLWEVRGEILAGLAPVAGAYLKQARGLLPLPVIHVAGQNDPLVKFQWQSATVAMVRRICGNDERTEPWGGSVFFAATVSKSNQGIPVVFAIHQGGHEYPKGATELIVQFFKENPKTAGPAQ